MPFTYRALTANCGNDYFGDEANAAIIKLLIEDDADFFVINCQEVDFEKTKTTLGKLAQQHDYTIECIAQMDTHTQWMTQFHSNTGIASYIIYKNDLSVVTSSVTEVRRSNSRLNQSAYNKGGLIGDFSVTRRTDGECIKVQTISGHLDSNNTLKRNQDWLNLHLANAKDEVSSWQELSACTSHLVITGYDTNTRNRITKEGEETGVWPTALADPEMQILYLTPFVSQHYGKAITYDKCVEGKAIADPKRPGFSKRGMLDLVGISNGLDAENDLIMDERVIQLGLESSTERDHHILISPVQHGTSTSDFDSAKEQIAARLYYVAPILAKDIRKLSQNEENEYRLIDVYNQFLSTEGLLNKAIALHIKKLEIFNRLKHRFVIKTDDLNQEFFDALFQSPTWCEGTPEQLIEKELLVHTFLDSIDQCTHYSLIHRKLDWYFELEDQINANVCINSVQQFKIRIIDEYLNSRKNLVQSFHDFDAKQDANRMQFQEIGLNLLNQLDLIALPERDLLINQNMSANSLDHLICIVEYCQKACEEINNQVIHQTNVDEITNELETLSQDMLGMSSLSWKAVGVLILEYVRAFLTWIHVLSPEVINNATKRDLRAEIKLSKTIQNYKSAVNNIADEQLIQEDSSDYELLIFG